MFISPLANRLMMDHDVLRYSILERKLYFYNSSKQIILSSKTGKFSLIHSFFKLKNLIKDVDFIHYQYISNYSILIDFLVFNFSKSAKIATLWGSDFYKVNSSRLRNLFFRRMDAITFTNPLTENAFRENHNNTFTRTIRFGLPSLDDIKKIKVSDINNFNLLDYQFKDDLKLICVGTNGSSNQNHSKIVKELEKIDSKILDNLLFIFPVGYPDNNDNYILSLEKLLKDSNLKHFILDKSFYSGKKLAIYRSLPDILIQLQTTDQFSGAMQEMIFAGVKVITAKWLPYDILDQKGVHYNRIFSFQDIPNALNEALTFPLSNDQKIHNKNVIYQLSSWDNVIKEWNQLYD